MAWPSYSRGNTQILHSVDYVEISARPGRHGRIGRPANRLPLITQNASAPMYDAETTESVLREISNQVHATRTAVLAQVTEQGPEVIDAAMERLGGEVTRRPVVEVEQEIAAAQEAQRKAESDARKENAHAKVEELKSKLHRGEARAAA
jgi:hypothetical protein